MKFYVLKVAIFGFLGYSLAKQILKIINVFINLKKILFQIVVLPVMGYTP